MRIMKLQEKGGGLSAHSSYVYINHVHCKKQKKWSLTRFYVIDIDVKRFKVDCHSIFVSFN